MRSIYCKPRFSRAAPRFHPRWCLLSSCPTRRPTYHGYVETLTTSPGADKYEQMVYDGAEAVARLGYAIESDPADSKSYVVNLEVVQVGLLRLM